MAKGVDVRQTTDRLQFRIFQVKATDGTPLPNDSTYLSILELQDDGTLKTYDFSSNTFKTSSISTAEVSMTHRSHHVNIPTTDSGIWTYVLTTLTGFTVGGIYFARTRNSSANPVYQIREFQFGEQQGDGLTAIADALLKRDWSAVTGEAARSVLNALRHIRNKWAISGGTKTVYKEDDSTSAWTSSVTGDAASQPIVGDDPA